MISMVLHLVAKSNVLHFCLALFDFPLISRSIFSVQVTHSFARRWYALAKHETILSTPYHWVGLFTLIAVVAVSAVCLANAMS